MATPTYRSKVMKPESKVVQHRKVGILSL